MNRQLSLLMIAAALVFSACTPKQDEEPKEPDVAIPAQPNSLLYASTVPGNQAAAVNEAISALYVLPLRQGDIGVSAMAGLMKTNDVSPEGLQSWMQARVQYIVEQNFDFDSTTDFSDQPFTYQEPNTFPDIMKNSATPTVAESDSVKTIMLNMGTAIYATGKAKRKLVVSNLPGIGKISYTSPRTGLLQIGEGLFMELGSKNVQNITHDIFRLGTLFHEARHSDGHGHTLGFMHATCKYGDYKGMAACDLATNGPYSVGASVLKTLMKKCESSAKCTSRSNTILQIIYLDQAGRTLQSWEAPSGLSSDARAATDWDDAPEGVR